MGKKQKKKGNKQQSSAPSSTPNRSDEKKKTMQPSPSTSSLTNGTSSPQKPADKNTLKNKTKKGEKETLHPLGIDLGTLYARIALGPSTVAAAVVPSTDASSIRILSNPDGARQTLSLLLDDEDATNGDNGSKSKRHYLMGESARKAFLRKFPRKAADGLIYETIFGKSELDPSKLQTFLEEIRGYAADGAGVTESSGGSGGTGGQGRLGVVLALPTSLTDKGASRAVAKKVFGKYILGYLRPSAAVAVAHGLADDGREWKHAAVIDWGASGLTATHFHHVGKGMFSIVSAHNSSEHTPNLLTKALLNHCAAQFKRRNGGLDINESARSYAKLWQACEYACKVLAVGSGSATVEVDGLMEGIDLSVLVSRPRFEMLIGRTLSSATDFLKSSILSNNNEITFDVLLLSGGLCKIPCISSSFSKLFTHEHLYKGRPDVSPEEAVAIGCAVHATAVTTVHAGATTNARDVLQHLGTEEEEVVVSPVSIGIVVILGEGAHEKSAVLQEQVKTVIGAGTPLPAISGCDVDYCNTDKNDTQYILVVQVLEGGEVVILGRARVSVSNDTEKKAKKAAVIMELTCEGQLSISLDGGPCLTI